MTLTQCSVPCLWMPMPDGMLQYLCTLELFCTPTTLHSISQWEDKENQMFSVTGVISSAGGTVRTHGN